MFSPGNRSFGDDLGSIAGLNLSSDGDMDFEDGDDDVETLPE
jgi:hypothetical protein